MTGYLTFEIRRVLRDTKFLLFAVVLPAGLFLLESGLFTDVAGRGSAAYTMGGLAAFGALKAALDAGSRTAVERSSGWQRQLRLTPLSGGGYLVAKGTVAMLVAFPPVAGVALAAFVSGVELPAGGWAWAVLGSWAGTVPFALLGLLAGQLVTARNAQVVYGGLTLVLGFLGGLLIPVGVFPPGLAAVAQALPSHWLAELGHAAATGGARLGAAAAVLALYTVVLGAAVVVRYRRDSART
ncbi:ABC transporter permease [Streptosporangium pseudovulgare]|uniref:ABC transporter n=1 Tax=Streptosporangium pseudovulgare TaxID=35765 RepID=A0ABQ2R3R0_9ACTN|nr:ABC transporter permease [Streptosporangium pseudovulgare]GGQ07253.1 ABC transporter [Streptosporangium pseudovulgare]